MTIERPQDPEFPDDPVAAPGDVVIPAGDERPSGGRWARFDEIDRRLSERILVKPHPDGLNRHRLQVLRRFSEAGSYGIGWICLFAIAGIISDGWLRGFAAAGCVIAMLLLNTVVKSIIRRPRPHQRAIEHAPTTFSMPSAHTSMAMVGASTMSVIEPRLTIGWWVFAVALGASRVMLGMHYLFDVLAGAVLGLVCGLLVAAPLIERIPAG